MIRCVDCDAFTNITAFFGLLFCILVGSVGHGIFWDIGCFAVYRNYMAEDATGDG